MMGRYLTHARVPFVIALVGALSGALNGRAQTRSGTSSISPQVPGIGIAVHKPVFGGAPKSAPWGVIGHYLYIRQRVAKAGDVPLHPGAARYYRERHYLP